MTGFNVLNEIGQGELVNQDLSDTKENNKVVKTQLDAVVRYIHEYYETQDVKEVKNLGFHHYRNNL